MFIKNKEVLNIYATMDFLKKFWLGEKIQNLHMKIREFDNNKINYTC